MKRKALSLLLALTLVASLVPAAFAAEPVTPTPPEWINPDEYVVFEGGKVYEPTYWECVLYLREHALSGGQRPNNDSYLKLSRLTYGSNIDAAAVYEKALIDMMYHKNRDYARWTLGNDIMFSILLKEDETLDEASRQMLQLWSDRWIFQMDYYGRTEEEATIQELPDMIPDFVKEINETMTRNGMTSIEQFLDCGTMEIAQGVETYQWMAVAGSVKKKIAIVLDGQNLRLDVAPEVKNERTMVPIRAVAEALGADVEWVQDTQEIVMTRAGVTVTMTLNSATATIDDKTVEMDVAPYATDGRTLIPARYVAEFFGQKVDWDGDKRQVLITEDKSVAGDSNLEAWALPMGAMLSFLNYGDPSYFGLYGRVPKKIDDYLLQEGKVSINPRKNSRDSLSGSWNIDSREDLINTVLSMTFNGHNSTFREMAADVKNRTQAERDAISASSSAWPSYMWEYTEYLDEKWGDRGIMAWDLFRMSNLVQWGYNAGYVSYEEALALIEPAAIILCANFSSWDEAYENYLDGYNWWAREDIDAWCEENKETLDSLSKQEGWQPWMQCRRGPYYFILKHHPIFDDTLFETGVIGLPEE